MATLSFETDLVIDTDEKAKKLIKAIDKAKEREPTEDVNCSKLLDEGRKYIERGKLE